MTALEAPAAPTAGPTWAKGYPVEYLKRVTALFAEHDKGMVHGAFGRYSELDAANDLAAGRLHLVRGGGRFIAAWVGYELTTTLGVRDFTGSVRMRVQPGTYYVPRMAWRTQASAGHVLRALSERNAVAVWAWQEHTGERALVRELGMVEPAAVKITAASEMRGLYVVGAMGGQVALDRADRPGLAQLEDGVPEYLREAVLARYLGDAFAAHYSSYNRGGSWSALSLRGFYDDPLRIEKPAEMSKRWKAEHPRALDAEVRDTRAMSEEVRCVLDMLPARRFERVRLMRLAPGGGELTRHADITDPDAGATPGKLARLHVPLVTNPECVFTSWTLDGLPVRAHMRPGAVWYLDTRKPHTAVNAGQEPRVHLVADAWVGEELHAALRELTY